MSNSASKDELVGTGYNTRRSTGHRVGALSWDKMKKKVMDLVENVADLTRIPGGRPNDAGVTEDRVRELLAQSNLAEAEFLRMGTVERLDEAIEYRKQALSLTPEQHESRRGRLADLGMLYEFRFGRLGELTDSDKAIEIQTQVLLLTPADFPLKLSRLHNLGNSYQSRFERLGELTDINKAIEFHTQAVTQTPYDHVDKIGRLGSLGDSYRSRFERLGALDDIDKAIECQIMAVALCGESHRDSRTLLSNLGTSYELRFEHFHELADLSRAIECHTQAAQLDPDEPSLLASLGNAYLRRFEQLGKPADISEAVDHHTRAVALTPEGDPSTPGWLQSLGASYRSRFNCLGELKDIDKAIEFHTQAMNLTPDDHPRKPSQLDSLGSSYLNRFERLGEAADIDKAIECHTQAVLLTPDGHAEKPNRLSNIGSSHKARFERLGELVDINKAIEFQNRAVLLTHDGHGQKPSLLGHLGSSYTRRFERLGELTDIDKAIECQTQAVLLIPDDHAGKPIQLNNLGISYETRFERLGELEDINNAIELYNQAVLLTHDGHPDKPSQLNNLGSSYQARFENLVDLADIDKAIEAHTRMVQLTPDGHAQQPRRLNSLGNSYLRRFEVLGELADIEKAIEYHTRAVGLSPDGHEQEPTLLSSLGNSYLCRFNHLGELSDVNKAIEVQARAVANTLDGCLDKPNWLKNLGQSYHSRFERLGDTIDLESALSAWRHAAGLVVTNPETQLNCARKWAKYSSVLGLSPQSAYERCMELIPHRIWLGATIDQRYYLLVEVSELATEAAAWAISVRANDLALEWLEEGRSIVWNQILQLRTPFDDLSSVDPGLAGQLKDIAIKLERASVRQAVPGSLTDNLSNLERDAHHHHQLATQWEHLLGIARKIPGFSNFMRSRKAAELLRAARDGPVVAINVHETRCDALIIRPNITEIVHIPLTSFSAELATSNREQLMSLTGHRGTRGMVLRPPERPFNFRKVLATLWSDITKPILDYLGYMQQSPIDELPKITWCTTGAVSFLPLHAAGCYDGTQPNAPDLVVSSYTPTLGALLPLKPLTSSPYAGLLAVGQEEYPSDLDNLPGTVGELAAIKDYAEKIRYKQLDGRDATVDAVLSAMDEHSWVHLACHALQNRGNVSQSAFHLYDGSLTLETIAKRSFKDKGLAFLSACQTATGHDKLPDEALHLAAGMLMAGYPSVIATMWSIWDIDGPEVARGVYAELLKDEKMDCTEAARALHKAVAALRQKVGLDSFKRWVPFIHFGV